MCWMVVFLQCGGVAHHVTGVETRLNKNTDLMTETATCHSVAAGSELEQHVGPVCCLWLLSVLLLMSCPCLI